ncbi:hypothetical protein [Clavibacter michiganensis]|uniref:hypothetical protein n=1 Tax=Clavibacter michiganensis TaxID=28447 RepID=UPI0026DD3309|nr:hypothetical protein [Clavibacter michiganensis]MDO4144208.1 hypothetical protein [Clavibacter michiganensis]
MSTEAADRWFALAQQFPVSSKSRGGMLRSATQTDIVQAGQLRQADWQQASAVLVIDRIDDDQALAWAFPATLAPDVADTRTLIVDADASPVSGPLNVWPAEAAWIPFAALDAVVATLSPAVLRAVRGAQQPDAVLDTAAGVRRGRADPPLGSGSALAIDDLLDATDALQRAPRLTPRQAAPESPDFATIALPIIMQTLKVSQPRAMAIRLGKEQLTADEALTLAGAAGVTVQHIQASQLPLPEDLERELQEPRWRPVVRARSVNGDEAVARTQLGYEAFQLAARESGDGRDRWRQRLEAVIALRSR